MASEQRNKDNQQQTNGGGQPVGLVGKIEAKYHELKEHAETYPYVWASYTIVYGGFGLWLAYRWRKLQKTEDRVRVLQERLRQLAKAEESASSSSAVASSEKPSTPADVDKSSK